jgi:hypothetical protein
VQSLGALGAWHADCFRARVLPLHQFTALTIICSQLARAKAEVGAQATRIVAQVRALLIETGNEDDLVVSRELQKRRHALPHGPRPDSAACTTQGSRRAQLSSGRGRNDPHVHYEEQIRKQTSVLQTTKLESRMARSLRRWERVALVLELRALDGRTAKLQRCEEKYIRRLKRSMTLSGLVEVAEEAAAATKAEKGKKGQKGKKGGGGEEKGPKGKGGGAGEIPKKAMVLIRLEQDRLERLEETVRRAEEKVVAQRDALRAAAQAFEEEKRAILAEHQEVMRVQEEQGVLAARLDKRGRDVEEKLRRGEDRVAKQRAEVEAKLPAMREAERAAQERVAALEVRALGALHALAEHPAAGVAAAAREALEFAAQSGLAAHISPDQLQGSGGGGGEKEAGQGEGAGAGAGAAEVIERARALKGEERRALLEALRVGEAAGGGGGVDVLRRRSSAVGVVEGGEVPAPGPAQLALMRGKKSLSLAMDSPLLSRSGLLNGAEAQPGLLSPMARSAPPVGEDWLAGAPPGEEGLGMPLARRGAGSGASGQGGEEEEEVARVRAGLEEREAALDEEAAALERERAAAARAREEQELAALRKERALALQEAELHERARAGERTLRERAEVLAAELAALEARHAEGAARAAALQAQADAQEEAAARRLERLRRGRAEDRAVAEHLLAMLVPESALAPQPPTPPAGAGAEDAGGAATREEGGEGAGAVGHFKDGVYVGPGAEAVTRQILAAKVPCPAPRRPPRRPPRDARRGRQLVAERAARDRLLASDARLAPWHLAVLQGVYRAKIQARPRAPAPSRLNCGALSCPRGARSCTRGGAQALEAELARRRRDAAAADAAGAWHGGEAAAGEALALRAEAAQDREHHDLLAALAAVAPPPAPPPPAPPPPAPARRPPGGASAERLGALPELGALSPPPPPPAAPRVSTAPPAHDLSRGARARARGAGEGGAGEAPPLVLPAVSAGRRRA